MWPVLTLTFLLQLTEEEQLFAQQGDQQLLRQQQEQTSSPATVPEADEAPCATWPDEPDPTV